MDTQNVKFALLIKLIPCFQYNSQCICDAPCSTFYVLLDQTKDKEFFLQHPVKPRAYSLEQYHHIC